MKANRLLIAAMIAMAAPAPAQQMTTVQQDFDAAAALSATDDKAAALAAWEALARRIPSANKRSQAILDVRKSGVLFALDRKDEAVAAARAGLADLPENDVTLQGDRFQANFYLAQIAESGLDYASAAEAYRAAEPLAVDPRNRLGTLRGLISVEIFTDPERATSDLVRAYEVMATAKVDDNVQALFFRMKAELLLNQGKFDESRTASKRAVDLLGGLTYKIDLNDVAARSDYAIASLLAGKDEEARKYMAYTGAGRLPEGSFDPGVQMKVPECGGDVGLRPDDAAVIEFSIDDNGVVTSSSPVYAAGGGTAALEFARAARDWSFTPEQVKELPEFFRYRARVELRCSTAFQRPSLQAYLDAKLGAWLSAKGVELAPLATGSDARALPQQRARLAKAESGGKDAVPALIPLLHALSENSIVGREETNAIARRELAIAIANRATPMARLAIERIVWNTNSADSYKTKVYLRDVGPALASAEYRDDPEARAAIRLMIADVVRGDDKDRAHAVLQQISTDDGLAANHPLKVGALIRLASLDASEGKPEAARQAFESSGLSTRQCAIVDSPPALRSVGGSPSDYPAEAQRWGFEGWTNVQFDIAANGSVLNKRVILSYPPFVFSSAGAAVVGGAKFEKTYRPDGGLGCGGSEKRVRFMLHR